MVNIIACYGEQFVQMANNRKVIIFGCGELAKKILDLFNCKNINIDILAFTDNNKNLWGKDYIYNEKKYPIISIEQFYKMANNKDIILLIAVSKYLYEVLEQLDNVDTLNDTQTYLASYLKSYYKNPDFCFPATKQHIPKKIHYCWFGGKPIPKHLQECIDTWYKYCPDYEIILWDENNYDYTKNKYMREAYENRKWGFVSDYARLDIVYNHGGIYLDTDVKLIKSLDPLLNTSSFYILMGSSRINTGLGFGAKKYDGFLRTLRDDYDNKAFVLPNGDLDLTTCSMIQTPLFKQYGFKINNEYQCINGCALYPSSIIIASYNNYTRQLADDKTIGFHLGDMSWSSDVIRSRNALLNSRLG